MQQNEMSSSSYYQYYQSHLQNPNPNPNSTSNNPITDPSNFNPTPPPVTYASAPPVSSTYDYSHYYYYSSNPDNPNPQPYSVPQPYNHTQFDPAPPNYDYPNSSYDPNWTTSSSYHSYDRSNQTDGNYGGFREDVHGDGIYAYNGANSKLEPYGTRGSRQPESSSGLTFDDYGRPINVATGGEQSGLGTLNSKVVQAAPKIDMKQDVNSGVQKFRVRLLSEGGGGGGGERDMDVLCQIGLDGIRILDAATIRTLKIYPLKTVTRWEVLDSTIFAFWAKSSVDIEARRIRLKSTSYTTNNILYTVAAATIQLKEMGGSDKPSDPLRAEQLSEKKKGFADWMNLMKPGNEEKDHWVPDEATTKCTACRADFGAFLRRHHCRNCGDIFCDKCTQGRITLAADDHGQPVRVCDQCMAEVTQRLTNAMETTIKVSGLQSHEDLAKKLQV